MHIREHIIARWDTLREQVRTFRLIFSLMRGDEEFFQFIWRFQELRNAAFWRTAKSAVESVKDHRLLNEVSVVTERTPFCPRCGQVPDGDRRMDEARELAAAKLWKVPVKRSELDFALSYWYLVKK